MFQAGVGSETVTTLQLLLATSSHNDSLAKHFQRLFNADLMSVFVIIGGEGYEGQTAALSMIVLEPFNSVTTFSNTLHYCRDFVTWLRVLCNNWVHFIYECQSCVIFCYYIY